MTPVSPCCASTSQAALPGPAGNAAAGSTAGPNGRSVRRRASHDNGAGIGSSGAPAVPSVSDIGWSITWATMTSAVLSEVSAKLESERATMKYSCTPSVAGGVKPARSANESGDEASRGEPGPPNTTPSTAAANAAASPGGVDASTPPGGLRRPQMGTTCVDVTPSRTVNFSQ